MKGVLKILTITLVLQLAVVIGLNLRPDNLQTYTSEEALVTYDVAKIDHIEISEKDVTLKLAKEGDVWRVSDNNAFTADSKKITQLLEKIKNFKRTWPVAQTEPAFKSLKVTDQQYERRLQFKAGAEEVANIILGTSPSFNKVHARLAKDNYVYALELNVADLPTKAGDWYDREYLYLKTDKVEQLTLPQFSLLQKDGKFTFADLTESEQVNQIEMDALAGQILQLRYSEMLGKEKPKKYDQLKEELSFKIKLLGQEQEIAYLARGVLDENSYVLKRSDSNFYFKIPKGVIDKIRKMERSNLVEAKEEEKNVEASVVAGSSTDKASTETK